MIYWILIFIIIIDHSELVSFDRNLTVRFEKEWFWKVYNVINVWDFIVSSLRPKALSRIYE